MDIFSGEYYSITITKKSKPTEQKTFENCFMTNVGKSINKFGKHIQLNFRILPEPPSTKCHRCENTIDLTCAELLPNGAERFCWECLDELGTTLVYLTNNKLNRLFCVRCSDPLHLYWGEGIPKAKGSGRLCSYCREELGRG